MIYRLTSHFCTPTMTIHEIRWSISSHVRLRQYFIKLPHIWQRYHPIMLQLTQPIYWKLNAFRLSCGPPNLLQYMLWILNSKFWSTKSPVDQKQRMKGRRRELEESLAIVDLSMRWSLLVESHFATVNFIKVDITN